MLLKFQLADGKIKFYTHNVEWTETRRRFDPETRKMIDISEIKTRDFLSLEDKDAFILKVSSPVVTEYEVPTTELLTKCENRLFSEYDQALAFVNGTYEEPLTLESLAEVLADIIGGAANV